MGRQRTALLVACAGLAVLGVVLVAVALLGSSGRGEDASRAGNGGPDGGRSGGTPGANGPGTAKTPASPPSQLKRPIEMRPVVRATPGRCASGSKGIPAEDGSQCYDLEAGFSIEQVESIGLTLPKSQTQWSVQVKLDGADGDRFAVLTQKAAGRPEPQNQIAIVVDGTVVSAPAIMQPILGGSLEITTPGGRDAAESLLRKLTR